MKRLLTIVIISLSITSCEKNIDFKTTESADILVVDGSIENGKAPQIVLTHSLNYFAAINAQIAANSFVHNAVVTLNNGTTTSILKEVEVPLGIGYTLYYYTNDPTTPNSNFLGEQGKSYDLKITVNGQDYTSITHIPILAKKCDSLWWKTVPNNPDTTLAIVQGKFTDPLGLGNYIRYFTSVNNQPFLPGEKSAFDDQVVDGKTYDIQIDQGVDRNNPPDNKVKGFFHRGDSVMLKFCNTDKATYTFWNTWEFANQSVGNPFSTPNKVLGNISNGALGAFCGYSVDYKKLIIPKL